MLRSLTYGGSPLVSITPCCQYCCEVCGWKCLTATQFCLQHHPGKKQVCEAAFDEAKLAVEDVVLSGDWQAVRYHLGKLQILVAQLGGPSYAQVRAHRQCAAHAPWCIWGFVQPIALDGCRQCKV